MKINRIEVKNFKAIKEQSMEFNGCSAIITGANNSGKTSILRGLIDRIRGEKPDIIIRQGEEKGYNLIELNDGAVIEWKFSEKTQTVSYISPEGFKQTQGVISTLGDKYFGKKFDIDKFLLSTPKEQTKTLLALLNIDLEEIDKRFKNAYEERTIANREVKRLRAINKVKPLEPEFDQEEFDALTKEIADIKEANKKAAEEYDKKNQEHINSLIMFNNKQKINQNNKEAAEEELDWINQISFLKDAVDVAKAKQVYDSLPDAEDEKPVLNLPRPEMVDTSVLEGKLESMDVKVELAQYESRLQEYNDWVSEGKAANKVAEEWDEKVNAIEKEKQDLIKGANMPKEFEITEEGLLYNGLPLTNNQISSSGKYIAALKLNMLALGKVKTMHFDASFLDKNSLGDVQKWAEDNDLQLLIERPDFEGGEIKYELIES